MYEALLVFGLAVLLLTLYTEHCRSYWFTRVFV